MLGRGIVIIVAHDADEHADVVQTELERRQVSVCRTSRTALPSTRFHWSLSGHFAIGDVDVKGNSGFWRRPAQADLSQTAAEFAGFVYREAKDAFDGAFLSSDIRWLSHPLAVHAAELKICQLRKASELGLPVPETLVSNVAAEAVAFSRDQGHVVVKPVRYGLVTGDPHPSVAWTTEVTEVQLAGLHGTPVILQKMLDTQFHLRVVTVGDRVFVSRLEAPELDWRAEIGNHARFVAVDAGRHEAVEQGATRLSAAFSLGYTAQDWVVDRDDRAWFLELNPSGQWLFVDEIHGGAITSAIVDRLEVTRGER